MLKSSISLLQKLSVPPSFIFVKRSSFMEMKTKLFNYSSVWEHIIISRFSEKDDFSLEVDTAWMVRVWRSHLVTSARAWFSLSTWISSATTRFQLAFQSIQIQHDFMYIKVKTNTFIRKLLSFWFNNSANMN